jgi:hypothetical protein
VNTSPIKFFLTGTINPTSMKTNEAGIMKTNNNTSDLFTKLNQEFNNQEFYGLQYILEDLFKEKTNKDQQNVATDWYGLTDLTI